jgi:hypothetical protein
VGLLALVSATAPRAAGAEPGGEKPPSAGQSKQEEKKLPPDAEQMYKAYLNSLRGAGKPKGEAPGAPAFVGKVLRALLKGKELSAVLIESPQVKVFGDQAFLGGENLEVAVEGGPTVRVWVPCAT